MMHTTVNEMAKCRLQGPGRRTPRPQLKAIAATDALTAARLDPFVKRTVEEYKVTFELHADTSKHPQKSQTVLEAHSNWHAH